MSITNTTLASPTYNGNGSTTAFATGFQFIANADLKVTVTDSSGVPTVQTLTTDYTVTGAGSSSGGTVTFVTAPASGTKVNIESNVTIDQQTDYVEGGSFAASTHETALDKLTKIAQQLQAQIDRSLQLPVVNQSIDPITDTATASYILRINAAGDGVEWVSSTDAALSSSLTPTDGGFVVGDGTDFVVETGATARATLGLTIGTDVQAYDATLGSLASYNTNGILTQTAADTFAGRTITGTSQQITVTNGDGVSGNPTLSLPYNLLLGSSSAGPSSITFFEDTDNGSNKIVLQAPSSLAADYTATLPTALPGSTQYLTIDNTGAMSTAAGTGSTSPGGSNTYVQYNNAGSFGGAAGFTFDGTGTAYLATGIELGHASDTTLTRSSAGDVAIEGNVIYRAGGTDVVVADGGTGLSSTTAYAVLCGGTTSTGALQSIASVGTSGQVLTSNGAGALPTFQTPSSGTWVKISSSSASSSSSISFTGLSSTYRAYMVVFEAVVPATSGTTLNCRTSSNNGVSYDSSSGNYGYHIYTSNFVGTGVNSSAASATEILLNGNGAGTGLANTTAQGLSGELILYNHASTATNKALIYRNSYTFTSPSGMTNVGAAARYSTSAVDAIQFYMSSGNITSGTFTLYGLTA